MSRNESSKLMWRSHEGAYQINLDPIESAGKKTLYSSVTLREPARLSGLA